MPASRAELAFALGRPFEEQVAFFRGKLGNLVPTAKWNDIQRSAHDTAFMVAGAAKADLLADLAAAVDKAISEGETIAQFRRRFGEIVRRHGWSGWTGDDRNDPADPKDKGGAGTAWRTRVIYRTNMATSYAAGRLAQLQSFPLWVYRHGGSEHPRLQHLSWNGLTLPADHEFWKTHYPPNGWGCSCYVTGALSREMARHVGGNPDYDAPPSGWNVPDGKGNLPGVQKGWDYMPGGTVRCIDAHAAEWLRRCIDFRVVDWIADKAENLPHPLGAGLLRYVVGRVFPAWAAAPKESLPLVRLPEADAALLGARTHIGRLSPVTYEKQKKAHGELGIEDYLQAQDVIDSADIKDLQDNIDQDRKKTGTHSLVYVRLDDPGGYVLVVKATLSGNGLWVTSYRKLPRSEAGRDQEVARLLHGGGRKD